MKRILLKTILVLASFALYLVPAFGQAPESLSYQAVIRNSSDALITNTQVGMQISILQGSASGTAVYVETQTPTSNANGLVSIEIGAGTSSDDFSDIDWSTGTYFIKTEIDPEGGTNYTITGVSQLLSVPYALHAKTAETVTNLEITGDETAFDGWDKDVTDDFDGDYNSLTNQPTIPTVPTNVSAFTNDAGYVTENTQLSETQVDAMVANNGYITTEVDGSVTNEIQNLDQVLTQSNDANAQQIKNIANPTEAQDAATKAYVDELISILGNVGIEVVDFIVSSTDIQIGEDVTFTDNSALNATTWLWDFGDGNTSNDENPVHTYSSTGTYTVSLTASNEVLGNTKTKNNYINVVNSFIDSRDGNVYQYVIIGNQVWMAENLKYLPSVVGSGTGSLTTPYYYVYGYNGTDVAIAKQEANYQTYGVLYNWQAAMAGASSSDANPSGVQGVCPAGWHLPSDAEWTELRNYICNDGHYGTEGTALKATSGWNSSGNGTDDYGFSGLPGGYRGYYGSFYDVGNRVYFWSASEDDSSEAWYRSLGYGGTYIIRGNQHKEKGYSVRCVRD